jgi:hypothetical protein
MDMWRTGRAAARGMMLAVGLLAAGPGAGQENGDWTLPNPYRDEGIAATCNTWEQQRQAADPQAMQALAGVWQGMGMVPGVAGIMADTPIQIRSMNAPDGTFRADRYGCFQMQSVAGMPPLQGACATSVLYGEWAARFVDQGVVAVVTRSAGSGFNGEAFPTSCAIAYWRFLDASTIEGQDGSRMQRVQ